MGNKKKVDEITLNFLFSLNHKEKIFFLDPEGLFYGMEKTMFPTHVADSKTECFYDVITCRCDLLCYLYLQDRVILYKTLNLMSTIIKS